MLSSHSLELVEHFRAPPRSGAFPLYRLNHPAASPLHPVVGPFTDHQVRVRVLFPSPMDRQRVGQPLPLGEKLRELPRRLHPIRSRQFGGQGEHHLPEQTTVRPLVEVRRFPIGMRVPLGPLRHVARFGVLDLEGVPIVAALPLDVVVLRRGRLPAPAAADRGAEVVDCHGAILPQA